MWHSRLKLGIVIIFLFGIVIGYLLFQHKQQEPATTQQKTQMTMTLNITSPSFKTTEHIPSQFTCDGEGILPELIFSGIPEGAQSLALIMDDPDAPRGTFDHLVVWNIPPRTTGIKQSETIPGTLGTNSSGKTGYVSPCPPDREHRYVFTLYAVDSILTLAKGATKNELMNALDSHIIAEGQLIGLYNRKSK